MTDPIPAPEQQEEPVCARCGLNRTVWQHYPAMTAPAMPKGIDPLRQLHPFEPAPPPSEEAEAHWERRDGGIEQVRWLLVRRDGTSKTVWIDLALEAAIRRPIEEERDKLLEERGTWYAHGYADAEAGFRPDIETAEAQAQELRAALLRACADLADGGRPVLEAMADVVRWRALAARTKGVQMKIEQAQISKPDVVITLTASEAERLVRELQSYSYWSDVREALKEKGYI